MNAKDGEQGRKGTEQWYYGNAINGDRYKIKCPDRQWTNNYNYYIKLM